MPIWKNRHIHDRMFRYTLHLPSPARVELVNELAGTNYPLDTETYLLDVHGVDSELGLMISDCVIAVVVREGDTREVILYHLECMAYNEAHYGEKMFRYGYRLSSMMDRDLQGVRDLPNQMILVVYHAPRMPDIQTFGLRYRDPHVPGNVKKVIQVEIPVYNLQKLGFEKTKHVTALLPFQIKAVKDQFAGKGRTPESDRLLQRRIKEVMQVIDGKVADGILTERDAEDFKKTILEYVKELFKADYSEKELDKMVPGVAHIQKMGRMTIRDWAMKKLEAKDHKIVTQYLQLNEKDRQLEALQKENADLKRKLGMK